MEEGRGPAEWKILAVLVLIVLGLLAGLLALAWHGMSQVEEEGLRIWALVATLLLPVAGWTGYRLGHTEARGRMQGIDDGLDKVVSAAARAIDLKVTNIHRTKEAVREPAPYVILPPPEASFRMLEEPRGQEIIELE